MKKYALSLVIFFTFLNTSFTYALYEIKGKVIDADTKTPLPDVTVYIRKFNIVTKTNINGEFKFINIPNKDFYICASYSGYRTSCELPYSMKNPDTLLFSLELSSKVTVTKTPSVYYGHPSVEVTVIEPPHYLPPKGTNFIDWINKENPWASQITTGSAISKPSIRGLGHNRVLTIVNGVRQETQQWGDDHGIEVSPLL